MNDSWLDQYIEAGWAKQDHMLSDSEISEIHFWITSHKNFFQAARVGRQGQQNLNSAIRGDQIFWVDEWSLAPFHSLKRVIDQTVQTLRQELYLPIRRFEGHLASYSPGSFYMAHVDRTSEKPNRLVSMVFYLNSFMSDDGGELVLVDRKNQIHHITPQAGRLVIFDSQLSHEVRVTSKERLSVAVWLREDPQ